MNVARKLRRQHQRKIKQTRKEKRMNGRQMGSPLGLERVPLTEAEKEHLGPIWDRFEQAQKAAAEAQRDVQAVVKLFMAQHKDELKDGPEWQLDRDAFVRPQGGPRPAPPGPPLGTPASPRLDPPVSQEADSLNGSVEDELAEMMRPPL